MPASGTGAERLAAVPLAGGVAKAPSSTPRCAWRCSWSDGRDGSNRRAAACGLPDFAAAPAGTAQQERRRLLDPLSAGLDFLHSGAMGAYTAWVVVGLALFTAAFGLG